MRIGISLSMIVLSILGNCAWAQDASSHPLLADDWVFRLGGQRAEADVSVGLGNENVGTIPIIDLERGEVDNSLSSLWGNLLWQAPERWSVGFSYFRARAEGQKISQSDTMFGDLVIPAGTGIMADFTTDFYVLNGYYDFFSRPNRTAGIGLGVYALDLGISVGGQVGGQPAGAVQGADALAPLPTISAYYKHAFNARWAFMADVNYFSADIEDYDGDIFAARVSVEYWFNENWGLGAGYNYVDLDLTIDEQVFDQLYEVQYDSAFIFLTAGF